MCARRTSDIRIWLINSVEIDFAVSDSPGSVRAFLPDQKTGLLYENHIRCPARSGHSGQRAWERTANMKTVRTRNDRRNTYTYIDAIGKRYTLRAGDKDPGTGCAITEENISMLHRLDDNEVKNNLKNTRTPVQPWEKPILEDWKKAHPDKELPTRLHISIDISVEDRGEDADKGLLAEVSIAAMKKEDPQIERLHEVVEMLRPDQQELYQRIVIEEESMVSVAEEIGLNPSAVRHRMETIRKFIKKNF